MPTNNQATDVFLEQLKSVAELSRSDEDRVRNLPVRIADIKADQDIVREGDRPSRMFFIVEGFTCSYKIAAESKRQIVNFHLPGDAPDLQSLHLPSLDISIATITPCKIGFVTHEVIRAMCEAHPRIAGIFWQQTLIDASVYREWIANVARREAASRIAHLLCEMFVRLEAIGDVRKSKIDFPFTQIEIADAVGISSVHVNRSLQHLRRHGYIALADGTLEILKRTALEIFGDFTPDYLHLQQNPGFH